MAAQLYKLSHSPPAAADSLSTPAIRLASLDLDSVSVGPILKSIHPDSLTSLHLHGVHIDGDATLTALGTLRNLRQLKLDGQQQDYDMYYPQVPAQLCGAVAKMSQLTWLVVKGTNLSYAGLWQLPCSLHVLTLYSQDGGDIDVASPGAELSLQLQHLAELRSLSFARMSEQQCPVLDSQVHLALPQHVTRLELAGCVHAELPSGLQFASIASTGSCMSIVKQLPAQQRLQHLRLGGDDCGMLDAPEVVASVLRSMTRLTYLDIDCENWRSDAHGDWGSRVQLGAALQRLQGLRHLHLQYAELPEADMLRLCECTNLTHLGLPHAGVGMTDRVLAALACKLTGLEDLIVSACGLRSNALPTLSCLPLTRLRKLDMSGNGFVVDEADLFMLTRLQQLVCLRHPDADYWACSSGYSTEAERAFWAAMPCLGTWNYKSRPFDSANWEAPFVYDEGDSD